MFYGITDLPAFVLGTILIVLLPGPNSLYVMSVASRWGTAQGWRAAAGIVLGDTILMLLSVTGVASLLQTLPAVFVALRWAGAAYLVYLGASLLLGAWRSWRRPQPVQAPASVDPGRPFRSALLIDLMNPKAILFFVSFFVQFVSPGYEHPALSFLILGLIVQTCSILYLATLVLAGAHLAAAFRRRRRLAAVGTGAVGVLFMGFGLRLADAGL